MRQGGKSSSSRDNASKFRAIHRAESENLEFRDSIKTNHASAESSFQQKQVKSINDSDHPMRQGRTDADDSKDRSSKSKVEQCKDKENSETHSKENLKIQFNTRELPSARGHIVHSWDILLDMGAQ